MRTDGRLTRSLQLALTILPTTSTHLHQVKETAREAAAPSREVMLWVDGNNLPNESAAAWDQFMQNFTRYMRPAITSVAVCPYTVTENGSFGYQDITQPLCHGPPAGPEAYTGEIQERLGIPRFRKAGIKQYPLLAGCPGTGVVIDMMNSTSKRTAFIHSAVATAARHGFEGYNIDFELFGHPEDVKIYQKFLREFSDALATINASLTVDIDHCCKGQNDTGYACNGPGNAGYLGMTCADYAASAVGGAGLSVIYTLHTYVHDLAELLRTVKNTSPQIGARYGVGVEAGLAVPALRKALAEISNITDSSGRPAISHLGIWWNPPLRDGPSEEFMNEINRWLRHEAHVYEPSASATVAK